MNFIANKKLNRYYLLYTLVFNYAVLIHGALANKSFIIISIVAAMVLLLTGLFT